MQPIYIDLHIHTSENANNLNTNYDIAELVGQIKKLNGDSPFMISLTDHNTINKSAYLKAQNLDLNLIIGVELHIQNRAEAKSYHCHIYFNAPIEDAVIDSLNEILDELYPNKLPDRNDPIRQISKKSLIVLTHLISSYYHTAHKNMEHLIIASTMVKI